MCSPPIPAFSAPSSAPPMRVPPAGWGLTHAVAPPVPSLSGAAGLVLLLACAILANLSLSRHFRRSREMALRLAAGASTWDIFRQLLVESMVVALAGGVLGISIATAGLKLLVLFAARMTPLAGEIRVDAWVLLFCLIISLFTGVLFGSLPGFVASRSKLSILAGSRERTPGSES